MKGMTRVKVEEQWSVHTELERMVESMNLKEVGES